MIARTQIANTYASGQDTWAGIEATPSPEVDSVLEA